MKKYKRNPKATSKDYSKMYADYNGEKIGDTTNPQFYGLFHSRGRVKIDLKRMMKVKTSGVPDDVLSAASAAPRNTTYFTPARIKRHDYVCNKFRDLFSELEEKWNEFRNAFEKIQTPQDIAENSRFSALIDGGMENEDATVEGLIAGVKRLSPYHELEIALHANFIHQIASETLALMLREARLNGYTNIDMSRDSFKDFFEAKVNKTHTIDDLPHHNDYNCFFAVWNLLKHNSIKSFKRVCNLCPKLLLNKTYQNGELSQYILKIDDAYIETSLSSLRLFFDEFCSAFLKEDPAKADWDYDEYFENKVYETIKGIENPFGTTL